MAFYSRSNKSTQKVEAIFIPDDFIQVIGTNDRTYNVEVCVDFDIREVYARKASIIHLKISDSPPRGNVSNDLLLNDNILVQAAAKLVSTTSSESDNQISFLDTRVDLGSTEMFDSVAPMKKAVSAKGTVRFNSTSAANVLRQGRDLKKEIYNLRQQELDPAQYIDPRYSRFPNVEEIMLGYASHSEELQQGSFESTYVSSVLSSVPLPVDDAPPVADYVDSYIRRIRRNFSFPQNSNISLYVTAELLGSDESIVQTASRKFELARLIPKEVLIPGKAPHVRAKLNSFDPSMIDVEVFRDRDLSFKRARVFLIHNSWKESAVFDSYDLNLDEAFLQSHTISTPALGESVTVRAVALNSAGQSGFSFNSCVVNPKTRSSSGGIISATQMSDNVFIKLESFHPNAVSAEFYAHDVMGQLPPELLGKINSISAESSNFWTHSSPQVGYVYKYFAKLFLDDGTTILTRPDYVEINPSLGNNIGVDITNLTVDTQNVNVTFSVDIMPREGTFDKIYTLMKDAGLEDFYNQHVSKSLDDLKKLIAYVVFRCNLTTGDREYAGSFSNLSFDDSATVLAGKLTKLNKDHVYRYEVFPSLADPTTIFDNQAFDIKDLNDVKMTINQIYNRQKFLHPWALRRNTLTPASYLRNSNKRDVVEHSVLGDARVFYASFSKSLEKITNLKSAITRARGKREVILTWDGPDASTSKIDFFAILRVRDNVREFAGRVSGQAGTYVFIDEIPTTNSVMYYVVPVGFDGSIMPFLETEIEGQQ